MLLLALSAYAQAPNLVQNESWCFTSGLRVLFEPDPARPEVRITTVVEGGSAGENGTEGLAHLTEHLWFRSRPRAAAGADVWSAVGALGGRLNGYTTFDRTVFTTVAPVHATKKLLQLEAARMHDPLAAVDDAVFAVERDVVRNELRQNYSDTAASLLRPMFQSMFPEGHPYHHVTIGTEDALEGLTLAQARAYTARWYTPENTTIHVSGDLDSATFTALLPKVFPARQLVAAGSTRIVQERGCRTPGATPVPLPELDEPPMSVSALGAVEQPMAVIAWTFPPEHATFASFDAWIAQNAMRSELGVSVGCHAEAHNHAGTLMCSFPLDGPFADKEVKRAIRATSARWEPNVRQQLANAYRDWRWWAMADLWSQLDRRGLEVVALHFHETGEQDWIRAWLAELAIDDFSLAARFGQEWLTPERAHTAVIKPSEDEPEALPAFHGDRAAQSLAAVEVDAVDQRFLDRIVAEPDWRRTAQQMPLTNGLVVTVVPRGRHDVVHVLLQFPRDPPDPSTPGLDAVTWSRLPDPTYLERLRALSMSGHLASYRTPGAWVYHSDGRDLEGQLELLREHLDTQQPTDLPRHIDRLLADRTTAARREAHARDQVMLGAHAPTTEAVAASVEAMKLKDLKQHARRTLRPDGAHLVIVGDVDKTRAHLIARSVFGDLKRTGEVRERAVGEVPTPSRRLLAVEDDVMRTQATVRLSCRLGTSDALTRELLARLVETRAEDTLRRSKGLTYGVHGWTGGDLGGPRLEVRTQVQSEGLAQAVTTLRSILDDLAASGPDPDALAAARLQVARTRAEGLQDTSDVLATFGRAVLQGVTPAEMGGTAARLMEVDAQRVKDALATCAAHELITVRGTGVDGLLEEAGLTFEER